MGQYGRGLGRVASKKVFETAQSSGKPEPVAGGRSEVRGVPCPLSPMTPMTINQQNNAFAQLQTMPFTYQQSDPRFPSSMVAQGACGTTWTVGPILTSKKHPAMNGQDDHQARIR